MRVIDLTGQVFGHLRVLERAGSLRGARWKCICALDLGGCGAHTFVCSGDLRRVRPVISCGCKQGLGPHHVKHGQTGTQLFTLWKAIKQRCFDTNCRSYYGDRGIGVYEPWVNSFETFRDYVLKNLGERPPGHSLDRIDNDGDYAPGNIRWATAKQQARNRRSTKLDDKDVVEILRMHSERIPQSKIAGKFGIGQAYVSQIVCGRKRAAA